MYGTIGGRQIIQPTGGQSFYGNYGASPLQGSSGAPQSIWDMLAQMIPDYGRVSNALKYQPTGSNQNQYQPLPQQTSPAATGTATPIPPQPQSLGGSNYKDDTWFGMNGYGGQLDPSTVTALGNYNP